MTTRVNFYLGGEGEIRTLGTVSGTTVFKTVTINHSVTSPISKYYTAKPCLTLVIRLLLR